MSTFSKQCILTNNNELFNGKIPIFSSIIAIGSTPFDTFTEINGNNFTIPYTQCCLEQNPKEIATNLINDFHKIEARGTLEYTNFFTAFVKKIQKLLPTEDFNKVFIFQQETNTFLISKDELNYLLKKLSSGQLQTFLLLTKIYCNIFYDTLFIFDEPEIHLHPNAILSFFRLLNYLLDTFKSYAIITTHSPIVIREMVGENVFILKRLEGDSAYIGHCDHETFGENISLLFNDTFKYDDSCSIFNDYINHLIKEGYNYNDIIKILELEGLSLNSRFTIRNLIEEHTHNENE